MSSQCLDAAPQHVSRRANSVGGEVAAKSRFPVLLDARLGTCTYSVGDGSNACSYLYTLANIRHPAHVSKTEIVEMLELVAYRTRRLGRQRGCT